MATDALIREIERKCCSGQESAVINKVVNFLDEVGEIIHVDSVVSLNPCWLSEYAIGPLIAPDYLKWHAKAPDGKMTREEADRAVKKYLRDKKIKVHINIDYILVMMVNIGVSFRLKDGTYIFPAHLPLKQLSDVWQQKKDKQIYVGRRYICACQTSIFSPSTFTLFQCQVCVKVDIKSQLWQDGMIIARAGKTLIQCLVVMVDHLRATDFVARGELGSESECQCMLEDVMREWEDVVEKHSPGTEYEMGYLSAKELRGHKEKPAAYSQQDIDKALLNGRSASVAYDTELSDSLIDLMVSSPARQGPCTQSAVVRAVLVHGCSQWFEIGVELGFCDEEIDLYCNDKPEHSGKLLVLLEKKLKEVGLKSLEELVLKVCQKIPHPIYGIVREHLDTPRDEDK
jgi:hypothetical protein